MEPPPIQADLYLDHASTSFPKPPAVLAAMQRWFESAGVSADRGTGSAQAAMRAEVTTVRERLGSLIGMPTERIAFTSGATESLNLFFNGWLRPGMRVLTTSMEHSAVARPLTARRRDIHLEVLRCPPDATEDALAERLTRDPAPDLVAFNHASNVTGHVLDAVSLCAQARRIGATTVVDASQTAGLLPVDVGADVVVASGHKALHGPPGVGILAARPTVEIEPTKLGGTGSSTELDRHPTAWPTAMESGTPNTPAILGLGAALSELPERLSPNGSAWQSLDGILDRLGSARGIRVHHAGHDAPRIPVASVSLEHLDPAEAGILAEMAGITVRTGFHCAPWVHEQIGTHRAGTVRISPGPTCAPDAGRRLAEAWGL